MRKLAPGQVTAFTTEYKGHPALLFVEAKLGLPLSEDEEPQGDPLDVKAIWDTGASASAISAQAARKLDLKSIGLVRAKTAGGECEQDTYLVSLFLPNRVCLTSLKVTEANLGDIDMLIGMDVIRSGDFAVTNHDGRTVCTYRYPSVQHIDFVKEIRATTRSQEPLRNDPCPCGSGKKYKKCCRAGFRDVRTGLPTA